MMTQGLPNALATPVWAGHLMLPDNREMSLNFLLARKQKDMTAYCHASYILEPVSRPLRATCERSAYSELMRILGIFFYDKDPSMWLQRGTTLAPKFSSSTQSQMGVTPVASIKKMEGKSTEYLLGRKSLVKNSFIAWRRGDNPKAVSYTARDLVEAQFTLLGLIGQLYYDYNYSV